MPVKSPAATPTKTRKTRTRKPSPTRTRKVAKTAKVIKEVQAVLDAPKTKPAVKKVTVTSFKSGKVVSKVTTLKRPSTARLISPQKYLKDISTRWAIHNYEIQELLKDFTKGFEAVKPYHAQAVKTVRAWTV